MLKMIDKSLIERAGTDLSFRAELLKNPKAVITRETGIAIPDDFTIDIVQAKPNGFTFVIPPIASAPKSLELPTEINDISDIILAGTGNTGYHGDACEGCND